MKKEKYIKTIILLLFDSISFSVAFLLANLSHSTLYHFSSLSSEYLYFQFVVILVIYLLILFTFGFYDKIRFLHQDLKYFFVAGIIFGIVTLAFTNYFDNFSASFVSVLTILLLIISPISRIFARKTFKHINLQEKVFLDVPDQLKNFIREFILKDSYLNLRETADPETADVIILSNTSNNIETVLGSYLNTNKKIFLSDEYGVLFPIREKNAKQILQKSFSYASQKLSKEQYYLAIKRIFDFGFLLIFSPFILFLFSITGLAILIFSGKPIIFANFRIGKDFKPFKMYKFRTMKNKSSSLLSQLLQENFSIKLEFQKYNKLKNDPRITPIGKFLRKTSLDEVPQFINVLIGNMNVVGPRPVLIQSINEVLKYKDTVFKFKPGITGLWQVSGRNQTTFARRLEIDAWYVLNWSIFLDLVICFKTVAKIISAEGAY